MGGVGEDVTLYLRGLALGLLAALTASERDFNIAPVVDMGKLGLSVSSQDAIGSPAPVLNLRYGGEQCNPAT